MKRVNRGFVTAVVAGSLLTLSGCASANLGEVDSKTCRELIQINGAGQDAIAAKDFPALEDVLNSYKELGERTPTDLGRSIVGAYTAMRDGIENGTTPDATALTGPGSPIDLCSQIGISLHPD